MFIDPEVKEDFIKEVLLKVPLKEILEEPPYETIEAEGKTYMKINNMIGRDDLQYIDPYTLEKKTGKFSSYYICLDEPICYDETSIITHSEKELNIHVHVYFKINEKMAINVYGKNYDRINGFPLPNRYIKKDFAEIFENAVMKRFPEYFV